MAVLDRDRQAVTTPADRAAVGRFEPRWPVWLALSLAIVLYATLPDRVIPGPRLVIPVLEGALLAAVIAASPRHATGDHPRIRPLAVALTGLVTLANIATLVLLSNELLRGRAGSGRDLIVAAIEVWLTNVIAFGLWYWELDRGGPAIRAGIRSQPGRPDFLFPQMQNPDLAPHWRPFFVDYLYTSFTNATAFSPTDTMPLSAPAKLLMMVQAGASLITVALVAARAVNILN